MNKQKIRDWFHIEKGPVEGLYYVPIIYLILVVLAITAGVILLIVFVEHVNPTQ